MSTPRDFFTVSRVLQMTGLHIDTLDMLHRELGDCLEVRITSGGNRLFSPKDIANLKEIKRLLVDENQDLGEIRDTVFPDSPPVLIDTLPGAGSTQVRVSDVAALESAQDNSRDPAATQAGRRTRDNRVRETGDPVPESHVRVSVEAGDRPPLPVEVRSVDECVGDHPARSAVGAADENPPGATAAPREETDISALQDALPAPADDVDPETITVPPLPVGPTVDLLLEATEGLVQENLKLRKAVDTLAERCLQVEGRLAETRPRRGLFGFFRR